MIGYNTHSDVYLLLFVDTLTIRTFWESVVIFLTREVLYLCNDWCEDVCIVVRVLALHETNETLEAHTCIDNVHLQWVKTTISLTIELHEYDVPYLNNLWVIFVYKFFTRHFCLLFLRTEVDMNL